MSAPTKPSRSRRARRVPESSLLFNWVIPALFILFALLMMVIVVFAVGVLTGIIHFR